MGRSPLLLGSGAHAPFSTASGAAGSGVVALVRDGVGTGANVSGDARQGAAAAAVFPGVALGAAIAAVTPGAG